jgi:hypothetical protein
MNHFASWYSRGGLAENLRAPQYYDAGATNKLCMSCAAQYAWTGGMGVQKRNWRRACQAMWPLRQAKHCVKCSRTHTLGRPLALHTPSLSTC